VTADLWHWWRTALANPAAIGAELIVTEQDIQAGYYRAKMKNGAWLPVVFWYSQNDGSSKMPARPRCRDQARPHHRPLAAVLPQPDFDGAIQTMGG
jgi:hypothetical protein